MKALVMERRDNAKIGKREKFQPFGHSHPDIEQT
jgi:hypothetical protein